MCPGFLWQLLLVRHTLDIMHYEKKLCDNLLKVVFGEKDIVAIGRDMEEVGIRPKLWVQQMANGSYMKPKAPYVMTNEKNDFFYRLSKS